jgi:hypothetical protein
MHDRAVPVVVDLRLQPLMRTAPGHFANLSAWDDPRAKTIELRYEGLGSTDTRQVYKRVA